MTNWQWFRLIFRLGVLALLLRALVEGGQFLVGLVLMLGSAWRPAAALVALHFAIALLAFGLLLGCPGVLCRSVMGGQRPLTGAKPVDSAWAAPFFSLAAVLYYFRYAHSHIVEVIDVAMEHFSLVTREDWELAVPREPSVISLSIHLTVALALYLGSGVLARLIPGTVSGREEYQP